MCGIVGIWRFDDTPPDLEKVEAMCDRLRHRGPDDRGTAHFANAALAMVRLSIIDVAGGHQPILNETEDLAIICNGEIYNHAELRIGLESRGHRFRTQSDVEVILHLYEEIGTAAFEKLNGMFACAIHDRRRGELVLARDRFGQKPLYLWQRGDSLVFTSEAKALLAWPDFKVEPSAQAVAAYLAFRYVPAPLTMFRDVSKLPPGSYYKVSAHGQVEQKRYWNIRFEPKPPATNGSALEPAEEVWQSLRGAVGRHLMSERPVGVFLSGGVDSGSIVACLQELGHKHVVTYTAGFAGYEGNELERARYIANRYRTDHHEVILGADTYWDMFDEIMYQLDEPNNATPAPAIYGMARQAVSQLTVVLSGEGSDELLAGYRGLDRAQLRFSALSWLRHVPAIGPLGSAFAFSGRGRAAMRWIRGTDADYLRESTYSMTSVFSEAEIAKRCTDPQVSAVSPMTALREFYGQRSDWRGLDLIQAGMIEWWLPDNLLALADRLTMAHSLELRCPFLDTEFADCCRALPASGRAGYPWNQNSTKVALKKAATLRLGAEFVNLPKLGFVNPANQWLNTRLKQRAQQQMEREDSYAAALFSPEFRQQLFASACQGDSKAQTKAWSLILLNRWADRWM